MQNILKLKTVNDLCSYSFFIPSYQRGYRWSSQEVKDLLNDIDEFKPRQIEDSDEKTWYCLQPIVVKSKINNIYEVIDGQQRLTTIFIILHYLNQDFVEARRDKLFDLDYETRSNTKEFLTNLGNEDITHNDIIDFYYIKQAYDTVNNWFTLKGNNFNKDDFRSKFKFNAQIIWYECLEQDTISVFTRLNIGKISLTNAELIKALFLNSSNYESKDDRLRLKQQEIASEWDNIENTLQNNKMWYFLTGNKLKNNRIEFIFDMINEEGNCDDAYSTFRYFSKKIISKSEKSISDNWQEIKRYFQTFKEWFTDPELYHKVGYLVYIDAVNLGGLYKKSSLMSKRMFKNHLDDLIKLNLKKIVFSELQYGDNKIVKKVLLLYNILTMLQNEQDDSRFPFDIFRNDDWDIEHITSIKESIPDKNRRDWLNDVRPYIDDTPPQQELAESLKRRIDSCNVENDIEFKALFEDLVSHFNYDIEDGEINDISNLTLLDSQTNRSYKNQVFPIKRKTIIDRDKSGVFIPICTKNVFLKYFSEYPPKISFWTQDDRNKYEEDLRRVLSTYLEGISNE